MSIPNYDRTNWENNVTDADENTMNNIEDGVEDNRGYLQDFKDGTKDVAEAKNVTSTYKDNDIDSDGDGRVDDADLILGQTPLILNKDRLRSVENYTREWDDLFVSQNILVGVGDGFLVSFEVNFDGSPGTVEFRIGDSTDNVLVKTFDSSTSISYNLMADENNILDTPFYSPIFARNARLEWDNGVTGSVTSKIITL